MNINEAMKIVSNVFANTHGTLADHNALQIAIKTIEDAVAPKPVEEKKE